MPNLFFSPLVDNIKTVNFFDTIRHYQIPLLFVGANNGAIPFVFPRDKGIPLFFFFTILTFGFTGTLNFNAILSSSYHLNFAFAVVQYAFPATFAALSFPMPYLFFAFCLIFSNVDGFIIAPAFCLDRHASNPAPFLGFGFPLIVLPPYFLHHSRKTIKTFPPPFYFLFPCAYPVSK